MYLSQLELPAVEEALHQHPCTNMFAVYELVPNHVASQMAPRGSVALRSVAFIFPQDRPAYLLNLLGQELEKLPLDQVKLELQKNADYMQEIVQKKEREAENV